ncbi:MAG: hypothetical protein M5U26_19540 [Planctomycetota bacterium]|nr:hypothetical protein [Planctomycetota bacterium]
MSAPIVTAGAPDLDFRRSLALLEAMLNDGAKAPAVRMQMREVENFGAKYPPGLRERAVAYIRNYEWIEQRRRRWTRVAWVVALLALAGGVAGWLHLQSKKLRDTAITPTSTRPAPVADPSGAAPLPEPDEAPAPMGPEERLKWREEFRRVCALLPDLDAYLKELAGLRPRFPLAPEVRSAERWLAHAPAYRNVLEFGARAAGKFGAAPRGPVLPPCREFHDFLLGDERLASGAGPYAELLRIHLDHARLSREGGDDLKHLQAQLKGDLMTRLREVVLAGRETGAQARYYTLDGERPNRTGDGQVSIPVFQDGAEGLSPKLFREDARPAIRTPAHVNLAAELAGLLEREVERPEWTSLLPEMFGRVAAAREADPYVRAILLAELFDLDANRVHLFRPPKGLREQVVKLCAEPLSFWLAGSPAVAKRLEETRARLETLAPELAKLAEDARRLGAVRKAGAAGLLRPLALSAVAERDEAGRWAPRALDGQGEFPEYWALVPGGGGSAFAIAAFRDAAGRLQWLPQAAVHPGQPLLSPLDRRSTREVLAAHSGPETLDALPATFPLNTGSAP